MDIIQEVGYTHLSTFSQAFRRIAGIAPGGYRRLCMGNAFLRGKQAPLPDRPGTFGGETGSRP